MRWFLLFGFLLTSGCTSEFDGNPTGFYGLRKWQDGKVTCYIYFQQAISCVNVGHP